MKLLYRIGALVLMLALLAGVCAAAGVQSVQIENATMTNSRVRVSGKLLTVADGVLVAFYNAAGKMIAVRTVDVVSDAWEISETISEAATVKAFATNAQFVPIGKGDSASLLEQHAVEVHNQAELIEANNDPTCSMIVVVESFDLTETLVIEKDLLVDHGVTLTVYSSVQCNGKVRLIGNGKVVDQGGMFAVEFGIEVVDGELGEDWG